MKNQSQFDPTRKTVGALYQDLQQSSHDPYLIAGDLTNEVMSSLVEDLNETAKLDPFDGKPFFVDVIERKDPTMPRAIYRSMLKSEGVPEPKDNTLVFWLHPKSGEVRFCWCLPHKAEIISLLSQELNFPGSVNSDLIQTIRSWQANNFEYFGWKKNSDGNWIRNENYKGFPLKKKARICSVANSI